MSGQYNALNLTLCARDRLTERENKAQTKQQYLAILAAEEQSPKGLIE
jgi:hypothetical protein